MYGVRFDAEHLKQPAWASVENASIKGFILDGDLYVLQATWSEGGSSNWLTVRTMRYEETIP